MKKILTVGFVLAGLLLSHPNPTRAQIVTAPAAANPTATPAAVSTFDPAHLGGHWAAGLNYDAFFGDYTLTSRYWFDDSLGLDLFLAGRDNSNDEANFLNQAVETPTWFVLWGLGLRENLVSPAKDVYVQAIEQFYYHANYSDTFDTTDEVVEANQDITLFAGLGYEVFVPFWQNLSISGQVGAQFRQHWDQQTHNFPSNPSTHYSFNFSEIDTNVPLDGLFSTSLVFYF
jgi:hypothetical protein